MLLSSIILLGIIWLCAYKVLEWYRYILLCAFMVYHMQVKETILRDIEIYISSARYILARLDKLCLRAYRYLFVRGYLFRGLSFRPDR